MDDILGGRLGPEFDDDWIRMDDRVGTQERTNACTRSRAHTHARTHTHTEREREREREREMLTRDGRRQSHHPCHRNTASASGIIQLKFQILIISPAKAASMIHRNPVIIEIGSPISGQVCHPLENSGHLIRVLARVGGPVYPPST